MSAYDWIVLLGIPTLCGTLISTLVGKIVLRDREGREERKTLRNGLQALLRAQMINDFNQWSECGYAPIYARDNFENCWKNYEALGLNGVMNDIHERFMNLPTEAP